MNVELAAGDDDDGDDEDSEGGGGTAIWRALMHSKWASSIVGRNPCVQPLPTLSTIGRRWVFPELFNCVKLKWMELDDDGAVEDEEGPLPPDAPEGDDPTAGITWDEYEAADDERDAAGPATPRAGVKPAGGAARPPGRFATPPPRDGCRTNEGAPDAERRAGVAAADHRLPFMEGAAAPPPSSAATWSVLFLCAPTPSVGGSLRLGLSGVAPEAVGPVTPPARFGELYEWWPATCAPERGPLRSAPVVIDNGFGRAAIY